MAFYIAIFLTIVTTCTIVGYLIFSNIISSKTAYAAITKYYTISNGEWSQNIWSGVSNTGASCTCAPTCNLATPTDITHKLNISSCAKFDISGGVLVNIKNGGNLNIPGDFTISGGSTLNIAYGDTVLVNGKVELSGGSHINVDGYLVIYNDLKLTGGSGICGTGQGFYTGKISGTGWCFTGTLPIKLVYFNAYLNNDNKVNLSWETSSEINNDHFTIERSSNGIDFSVINTVLGAGNSDVDLFYSWVDNDPLNGDSYYRLRQTDYDGKGTLSEMKHIRLKGKNESVSLYPNPVNLGEPIHFKFNNFSGDFTLMVFTSTGINVFQKMFNQPVNQEYDMENTLCVGEYFYRIDDSSSLIASGKFIVK